MRSGLVTLTTRFSTSTSVNGLATSATLVRREAPAGEALVVGDLADHREPGRRVGRYDVAPVDLGHQRAVVVLVDGDDEAVGDDLAQPEPGAVDVPIGDGGDAGDALGEGGEEEAALTASRARARYG
ncbi:hypothetical protein GCM10028801_34410 [Nocardioides maradonensis]